MKFQFVLMLLIILILCGLSTNIVPGNSNINSRNESLEERVQQLETKMELVGALPGEVRMWWGDRVNIPIGWEICDGEEVRTDGAVISGIKPDLVNRFPKGATIERTRLEDLVANGKGGQNNMPALKISSLAGAKTKENGDHKHDIHSRTAHEAGPDSHDDIVARGKNNRAHIHHHLYPENLANKNTGDTSSNGQHSHTLTGYIGKPDGIDADGKDNSGANQPAFSELFFIIRVK